MTGLALATPEFLNVIGARVVRGRAFDWRDGRGTTPVALVNESWVRRFSAERDPIGRQLWFGDRMLEIIGIVPDLQMQDPGDRNADGVYASMLQLRPYAVRVMARTQLDPLALTPAVRSAIEAVDPDLPLFEVASLYDAIYADKKVLDAFGALFLAAGVGALFLTMLGVYGIVSFGVTSRTREIGARVALGASPTHIMRLVMTQGARLIAVGIGVGLLLAFGISRALAAATEFLQPAAWPSYVAIAVALAVTAAAGLARPVRQALALQPMEALRRE
jgi:putative ABC transport system permease protein